MKLKYIIKLWCRKRQIKKMRDKLYAAKIKMYEEHILESLADGGDCYIRISTVELAALERAIERMGLKHEFYTGPSDQEYVIIRADQ